MEPERHCSQCGRKIPWGQAHCPFCPGHGGYRWSLRRDTFLLIVLVVLILLFIVTGFTVRVYHAVERGYADDWYTRGEDDLRAGRGGAALTDFRTALTYSHDNERYQLQLAQALMAVGQSPGAGSEARTYLLNLLEHEPGDGTINLELARLAARGHNVPDALRFYHGAIYGEWDDDPVLRRRAARLELVQFLLDAGQKDSARAELIAQAADLPADPALQTKVGNLLLRVAGYDDALKLFRQALREEPRSAPALAGAGECYFHNGDYAQAERYLTRALQQDLHLTQAAAMLDTAQTILNLDPFNRRLDNGERARRAALAFDSAQKRLQNCAAQRGIDLQGEGADPLRGLFAQATELQPRAQPRYLRGDSQLLSRVMDVAFEIEQATAHSCGEPQGADLALLLMGREQGGTRP
jgi:tetratricopeptide (TPR) repeat protein/predicted nucleic acid-binding Zn ribbon protein